MHEYNYGMNDLASFNIVELYSCRTSDAQPPASAHVSYQRNETSLSSAETSPRENCSEKGKKWILLLIKWSIGTILCAFVLVCTVFSKLTLVSLTDKLRSVTAFNETYLVNDFPPDDPRHDVAVSLYWQLLLVVIIPSIISWVRSLVFGVLGKTQKNFPYPVWWAILLVNLYINLIVLELI